MLPRVARTAHLTAVRQSCWRLGASAQPHDHATRRVGGVHPVLGLRSKCAAASFNADQRLKRHILDVAKRIRFRYEVDSHKTLTDRALEKAEQAVGCAVVICETLLQQRITENALLSDSPLIGALFASLCGFKQAPVQKPSVAAPGVHTFVCLSGLQCSSSMVGRQAQIATPAAVRDQAVALT